jgi:regulator of protease activity HflC (stomatin/prohibitin superfamily)
MGMMSDGMIVFLVGSAVFLFFFFLPGLFILQPRQEVVILQWGKFVGVVRGEGIRWSQPWGRSLLKVSTQDQTFEVHKTTVVEANGNPIEISAVVTYRVENSRKATLDAANYQSFVRDQATAVIKRVASKCPYDSPREEIPCLRKESHEVGARLIEELQHAVDPAGVHILSVRLNDLAYAPEIAQSMLIRQQAMAVIDARKTIVEGAVEIVRDCVERLAKNGIPLQGDRRDELVSNLLVVICSGERVTPTVSLSARNNNPKSTS